MARFIFLISLVFAFLALQEWPSGSSVWMRALIALASMGIGIGALALLAPPSQARRFKHVGHPDTLDRAANGLCLILMLGLFYFILVFAPQTTRQLHDALYAALLNGPGTAEVDSGGTAADPSALKSAAQDRDFEISAWFDPQGERVPKTARFFAFDEPQICLKMTDPAACRRLRDSGPAYVHAFSHNLYDGERWVTQGWIEPQKLKCGPDGLIHLEPDNQAAAYSYTILQYWHHAGGNTLNTLQGARFVELAQIMQWSPGVWILPEPDNTSGGVHEYRAGSSPQRFEDLVARGIPIEPANEDPIYLEPTTDPGLKLQITRLAARFRQFDSHQQRLSALKDWLSTSFSYSRVVDYPDDGKSALESFLTDPDCNQGFCVHFASAAVLLLREIGIPARISYGWLGGEFYEGHNQFVFRGKHGHAWAEVHLKDQGWVVFDATPSSAQPRSTSAPPGATPPAADRRPQEDVENPLDLDWAGAWKWVLAALGLGTALLFLLLFLKHRQPARSGREGEAAAVRSAPEYLQLFHQAGARLGHPKPIGRTLIQYLEELDQAGILIPFAGELQTYHYQIAYRGVPRDRHFERQLCRQIKTLSAPGRSSAN